MNNPGIHDFHLSLSELRNEPRRRVTRLLDLPAHVTSATFDLSEATPAFSKRFFRRAALPGVEVLGITLPSGSLELVDDLATLGAGLRNALKGAPRLRRLVLRAKGHQPLAALLTRVLQQTVPPACVVELSFELLEHSSASAALVELGLNADDDVIIPDTWAISVSKHGVPVPLDLTM